MMKKIITFFVAALVAVNVLSAQTLADGIKFLNYEKNNSAISLLKKLYDANSKDPQTIYWYGQSLLAATGEPTKDQLAAAKAVYQKALTDGVNDAWIWVGMGHVELLQGGDINAAKQKFEQAITATKTKKGENPDILNAIGRANADGIATTGDPIYGIDKLKRAAEINKTNPDIYNNMGICYRKLGSENGGDAVKSFLEALTRDPKNVVAMYQIGKIYYSQNNKEAFETSFNGCIAADPAFAPAYLVLFKYYAEKDVNKAKEYLDNFLKYADKDPANDLFYAEYLFRAGKYSESLAKVKEIEASTPANAVPPHLNILYAYDYDRLGDSIQAKAYAEKFFATAPVSTIEPDNYDLAIKIFSKFPGNEAGTVGILQKAIDSDTSKVNKLNYMTQAAEIYEKSKNYSEQLKWYQKIIALKGTTSELDFYHMSSTAFNAKDYAQTMEIAKNYMVAFPDKPQGYSFNVRAAKAIDTANATGLWFAAAQKQNEYLIKDTVKNKQSLVNNYYTLLGYYNDALQEYPKALEICDSILMLLPGEPQTLKIREMLDAKVNKKSAPPSSHQKPAAKQSGSATKPSGGSPK